MKRTACIVLAILTAPALAQNKDTAKEKTLTPSALVKAWQKKRQQLALATQRGNARAKEKAQKELDGLVGTKVEGNAIVQVVGMESDGSASVQLGIGGGGGGIVYLCRGAKGAFPSGLKKGAVVKVGGTVEGFKYATTKVVGKGAAARRVQEGQDTIVLKDAQLSRKKR